VVDDGRWIGEALRVAAEGLAAGELPIGAVVVLDDSIVASAYTQERSQGRLLVHADLLALDAADRILGDRRRDATLYVTLEPCLCCLGAAMTVMIGTVVYALASPSDGAASFVTAWDENRRGEDFPAYRMPEVRGSVRRAEAAALFGEYVARSTEENALTQWARSLFLRAGQPT
jgi:tRNA(adenine34) deaminase